MQRSAIDLTECLGQPEALNRVTGAQISFHLLICVRIGFKRLRPPGTGIKSLERISRMRVCAHNTRADRE